MKSFEHGLLTLLRMNHAVYTEHSSIITQKRPFVKSTAVESTMFVRKIAKSTKIKQILHHSEGFVCEFFFTYGKNLVRSWAL